MSDGEFGRRMKRMLRGSKAAWRLPAVVPKASITAEPKTPSISAKLSYAATIEPGPSLGVDERGAIWPIFPAEAFTGHNQISIRKYDIPHEDIRTNLLFFDRFDVPSQSMLGGIDWCAAEFRRVGVLSSSPAKVNGVTEAAIRELPFLAYRSRERSEPGRWTLARPAQALGIPAHELSPNAGVALTLQNALPTFTREVDLNEVLEFKHRAWAELIALRTHLDDLVKNAALNGINDFAQSDAYKRFTLALGNHIKLMNEAGHAKVWRSLKASCNLPDAAAPISEYLVTGNFNYATVASGAIMLGFRTVQGLRGKSKSPNPFEYLTSANLAL